MPAKPHIAKADAYRLYLLMTAAQSFALSALMLTPILGVFHHSLKDNAQGD